MTATMTTERERELVTRKGKRILTTLSDAEAIAGLAAIDSDFARDLLEKNRRYGLSYDQMAWAHKLVMDARTPRVSVLVGDLTAVIQLFQHAGQHLKYPKVRLHLPVIGGIRLSVCTTRSKFPGSITIVQDNFERTWLGRIHTDGRFEPSFAGKDVEGLAELLTKFAADPAGVAAGYGKLLGACAFCGAELSDPRSTAVGFGKICAGHFGLAW